LYAKWTGAVFTVTFNSAGGTPVPEQEVNYGDKAFMPSRPTNGNLALAGWYTDLACTNQWAFATDTVTDNISLYASWKTYGLRDTGPAGGLVFYDKGSYSDGWRYIEAAPNDLYDKGAMTHLWGNLIVTTATDDGVGKGASNTDKIIDTYGLFSAPYAARQCREVIIGDYSDWILPSYDEMDYMRTNLAKQGVGGFSNNSFYWSSTEDSKNKAYVLMFRNYNSYSAVNKGLTYRVRPARYF
jgi:hypothetical protein